MAFSVACFISYKRPPTLLNPPTLLPRPAGKHLWLQFAEVFEAKLAGFLNTNIPIFRDVSLQPGLDYPREFARNLCRSVCMVALVVPYAVRAGRLDSGDCDQPGRRDFARHS